jgi:hypothetical protein
MDGIEQKKIISLGVYAQPVSPHKGKGPPVERIKRDAYRVALEEDMKSRQQNKLRERLEDEHHPLESPLNASTRLREQYELQRESEHYPGYPIGNQTDDKELAHLKRERQHKYHHQLEIDLRVNAEVQERSEKSPDRRPIARRPPSPEIRGHFSIGEASNNDGIKKKEMARQFYALNQEEIERKRVLKTQKSSVIDIDSRFAIGVSVDKDQHKKREAQRQYLEALNKDIGARDTRRIVRDDGEYVNYTGWSGLNIGAAEGSGSVHQKREKQEHYRALLDWQQQSSLEKRKKEQDEEIMSYQKPYVAPPYMEHHN